MKNKMKQSILLLTALLASSTLWGQQESIITFYNNHMNLINPAFVGVDKNTSIQSTIREQWTGVKDAPSTQAISFMTPIGDKKLAMGISLINDEVFIEKQVFVAVDLSYEVTLNDKLNLHMGLKVGGNNYQVNTAGLQTYNIVEDPSLESVSRFNPNVGIGFYLKHQKYFVSLSTPKMLNTERAKNEDGFATVATDRAHFYLSSGYTFTINENMDLQPTFLIRYVNGAPFSTDFTTNLIINDGFTFGVTYRTDQSFAGLAHFKITENIYLGYAYEYSTRSQLIGRVNGSNEFFLKYKFL